MAKKSRKDIVQYKKDQSGCMKGLFNNIFDFRHGGSSQKLLQEKKHESKRMTEASCSGIQLESLSEPCDPCKEFSDSVQNETTTNDDDRMSVKELIEEEMIIEQDQERQGGNTSNGARVHRSSRRARSMTSLNLNANDVAQGEGWVPEMPRHRKHKSLSSIDLNVMVDELCSQINHKDGDTSTHLIKDLSVIEETLWEATRVCVSQFSDGKSIAKEGKIQASKELVNALRIIDSNKEMFLKLLQDPNSQLVKRIRNLQDVQVEEGKFKVLTDSNLLDKGIGNAKNQSFFWRKIKVFEKNPSKKNNDSEDLNRIVVLKPGPSMPGDLETSSSCSSLLGSPQTLGERNELKRASASFSLAEFRRKLKNVIRKEQNGVIKNGTTQHQISDDQQNLANRNKVGGETVAMASPSKDHFFIERIPSSLGLKKADEIGKLKDGAIYVEAKKHLAEIISDYNVDIVSPKKVSRSLGRLMSFSGYNSPRLCSPKKEGEERISYGEECQTDYKMHRANQESHTEVEIPCFEPHISDGLSCESCTDNLVHENQVLASGDIVRSANVESQAENYLMESSTEHVDSPSNSKCSEDNRHSPILREDTCTDCDASSSQIGSTLASLTDKIEDQELMSDATSKPSPISVLDPLFTEDIVSPPSIKSLSGTELVQPRRIHFKEEFSALSNNYPHNMIYIDDEKYTFGFVKAVMKMSGLTWDELLRRTLFSDHLIDPSLLDEVDFLPDLLPCDFNLLFDLINEVVIEISWLNFGALLSFTNPSNLSKLKNKDIVTVIWEGVEWYLKLEGPPRTLDQIVEKDLKKSRVWMNLRPDTEIIEIQLQEAILEELLEEAFFSCITLV